MQVTHDSNAHSDFRTLEFIFKRERRLSDTLPGHKWKAFQILLRPNSSLSLSHPEL